MTAPPICSHRILASALPATITMPNTNGHTNGHANGGTTYEMEDGQSFLFTSESVGEGHPGESLITCWLTTSPRVPTASCWPVVTLGQCYTSLSRISRVRGTDDGDSREPGKCFPIWLQDELSLCCPILLSLCLVGIQPVRQRVNAIIVVAQWLCKYSGIPD